MLDIIAEVAGWDRRVKEWIRVKVTSVKLEVLVRLYSLLWELGALSTLDERMAGNCTRRHLSGPLSKIEVQNKLRK